MTGVTVLSYLELLADDASPTTFDEPIEAARQAGADPSVLSELEHARTLALRVRRHLDASRRREAELSALYDTAGDLAAQTDLDAVLEAIVRRARRLLGSDLAYMTLTDEAKGDSYTTITDGGTFVFSTPIRVPMGEGVAGRVAETGLPYATASYFEDTNIQHTPSTDEAVRAEGMVSLLGVPLMLDHRVIGVLLAANRTERPFSAADTALMVSLATHAAVAIDKARLFREVESGLSELRIAGELLEARTQSAERAAAAHDRFTTIVLEGGNIGDVANGLRELLDGEVAILDTEGSPLAATSPELLRVAEQHARSAPSADRSRSHVSDGFCATPVVAGPDALGTLYFLRDEPMDEGDVDIVERAALVTALVILFRRSLAAGEERRRGELLEDILVGRAVGDVSERARLLGLDLDAPSAVVALEVEGDRGQLAQAAAHIASVEHGLSAVHDGRVIVVIPELGPVEAGVEVQQRLRRVVHDDLTVGVARAAGGAESIREAHREAVTCLRALVALGRAGEVARIEDLGFVGVLLGRERGAEPFISTVLGPLLEYDSCHGTSLEHTLKSYFDHGGNAKRTAADLHIHPKTVTQRLDRVGQILGPQWNAPANRLQLEIALHLRQVIEEMRVTRPTRTADARQPGLTDRPA